MPCSSFLHFCIFRETCVPCRWGHIQCISMSMLLQIAPYRFLCKWPYFYVLRTHIMGTHSGHSIHVWDSVEAETLHVGPFLQFYLFSLLAALVFAAVLGLSLAAESGVFLLQRLLLLQSTGSRACRHQENMAYGFSCPWDVGSS